MYYLKVVYNGVSLEGLLTEGSVPELWMHRATEVWDLLRFVKIKPPDYPIPTVHAAELESVLATVPERSLYDFEVEWNWLKLHGDLHDLSLAKGELHYGNHSLGPVKDFKITLKSDGITSVKNAFDTLSKSLGVAGASTSDMADAFAYAAKSFTKIKETGP